MDNISTYCKQLIQSIQIYSPEFTNTDTNHLPMALLALSRLGASDQQLDKFYDYYFPKLVPITEPTAELIHSREDVLAATGQTQQFPNLRDYFLEQLNAQGIDQVIQDYSLELTQRLKSSALHCLIRVAYAYELQDKQELASALAYWIINTSIIDLLPTRADVNLETLVENLNQAIDIVDCKKQIHADPDGNIITRMNAISKCPSFRAASLPLASQISVESIASLSVRAYLNTKDFTILHAVTGTHAYMTLSKFFDKHDGQLYLLQSIVEALLSTNYGEFFKPIPEPENLLSIEQIKSKVCNSHNDHTIKLTYSSLQLYSAFKNPHFLWTASYLGTL